MNPTQQCDVGATELERLFREFADELREWGMVFELYRETVADADRYIARGLAQALVLPAADPLGHELACALGWIAGVHDEVDELLAPVTATDP